MREEKLARLQAELDVINILPVVIPQDGYVCGYAKYLPPQGPFGLMKGDNFHYPMGVSYIKRGIKGVADLSKAKMAEAKDEKTHDFYEGIVAVYEAISEYLGKYVIEAEKLLSVCVDAKEKERLTTIRDSFKRISTGKPVTFVDSLNLVFIMSRIRTLDWHADIGRLDQHLYEFYKHDADLGMTDEEAIDLLVNFYDRINEVGSGDTLINIMVGGTDKDGNDVTNDLSVLMLKAGMLEKGSEPHINFRVHPKTRKDMLEAAYALQSRGRGQATMYNDETVIPTLVAHGCPIEYACRYMNDGCTEVMLDGCDTIDFNHIDAVATFVLAFNDGTLLTIKKNPVPYLTNTDEEKEYSPDVVVGFKSGIVENCRDFEEFYQCFKRQWDHQIDSRWKEQFDQYNNNDKIEISYFLNGTFEDALERGKGIYEGGLPWNTRMVFSGSIPTVADILMAIKKKVYDEKRFTISEIKKACEANFEGYEEMRQELKKCPKFGNDIDEVDSIAARIASDFCDNLERHYQETKVFISPALLGWRFVEEAHGIGATPDGRRYMDPIAEHYCATPGNAKNGPTATLNSITKADLKRAVGVAAFHISLPAPGKGEEERAVAMCKSLSQAAIKKGIVMLNLAIYDVDTLKDAQIHPERHQDLIVRVWGFCARFVDLSRQMQDHVIMRVS